MFKNKIADIKDVEKIYKFCMELKAQDAKMTFVLIENVESIYKWFKDLNIFLYVTYDEDENIAAMFRAKRGEGNKSHSVDIACAVKKEYRKMNLATDLTLFGLEDVKEHGVLIARTYIYSWNKASIATIKKCGFEESGRKVMHQYEEAVGDYIDDLIFYKKL